MGSVFISAVHEGDSLKKDLKEQHAVQMLLSVLSGLFGIDGGNSASKTQSST